MNGTNRTKGRLLGSMSKPVVLHLLGSAASDYYEGVSVIYAVAWL